MGDNTQLQLFRVYKTCWEMLRDRGYMVGEEKLSMTLDDFENSFGTGDAVRDSLTIVAARQGDSQDQVGFYCWCTCIAGTRKAGMQPSSGCR